MDGAPRMALCVRSSIDPSSRAIITLGHMTDLTAATHSVAALRLDCRNGVTPATLASGYNSFSPSFRAGCVSLVNLVSAQSSRLGKSTTQGTQPRRRDA